MTPQNRIPELDFLRGFCILAMIVVHFIYDLTDLYGILPPSPPSFLILKDWGGIVFFLISGISVTLGYHCLKRGCIVLGCALLVSIVTTMAGLPVRFGVLHCLGLCMVLWIIFRPSSPAVLAGFALLFVLTGAILAGITVSVPLLYPLGLCRPDFVSADYFPLFPYLGYFLAGACIGKRYYISRRSLLPGLPFSSAFPRFLCLCGRHSLLLYLIHQPLLLGLIEAAHLLGGNFHES